MGLQRVRHDLVSEQQQNGISQARILEWVAISFSRGSFRPRDPTHVFTTEPPGKLSTYRLFYP